MTKKELEKEIKETLGIFPMMFANIPDNVLEIEWNQFKKLQLEDGPIPNKYRELIGIGISAATKCKYCSYFHVAAAKLFGATDEEIQNAVHFAKQTTGWSTYVNGMQFDYDQFKREVDQIVEHVKSAQSEMV